VREFTFRIPWTSPPLTSNQRLHWAKKAKITREVRGLTKVLVRKVPDMDRIEVSLEWVVNTNHRRDVDNTVPTLKAICDGIVDAEIVPDDTPQWMVKVMPTIRHVRKRDDVAHFNLTIKELA
jgi:crossover junction endodeoxyribonuclease RusA